MAKKSFPTSHVATAYSGICMGSGIGIAQDVFDHLYPGIMTMGCAMMQPSAARALGRQIPGLLEVPLPSVGGPDAARACNKYMWELVGLLGAIVEVDGPVSEGA